MHFMDMRFDLEKVTVNLSNVPPVNPTVGVSVGCDKPSGPGLTAHISGVYQKALF